MDEIKEKAKTDPLFKQILDQLKKQGIE